MMVTDVCLLCEKRRKKRDKYVDLHPRIGEEDQVHGAGFTCYCLFLRSISLHTFAHKNYRELHIESSLWQIIIPDGWIWKDPGKKT